jgi:hypothetical protein
MSIQSESFTAAQINDLGPVSVALEPTTYVEHVRLLTITVEVNGKRHQIRTLEPIDDLVARFDLLVSVAAARLKEAIKEEVTHG